MTSGRRVRVVGAFIAALGVAANWGSVVQTQVSLLALRRLGMRIPWDVNLESVVRDLAGFAPFYAGIVLVGWLPAMGVAAWLSHHHTALRTPLHALAGAAAVAGALFALDTLAPVPGVVAATRTGLGYTGLVAGGAVGGLCFAIWSRALRPVAFGVVSTSDASLS
ncbi:hypothetical protein [Tahibacter amnicola]|uniref:Uncharacterized protein n=1 Tax=Tahibacter amnicola TaxID=2976241 RepID=A0ABY6BEM8_9GAMM|nr:hypothetical protein [Tahibacter amnicola]UXI68041.1 hypothetical protein N4264_25500 [Tahibacter amnicola]